MAINVDVIVPLPVIVFVLTAAIPSEEALKEIHTKPAHSVTLLLNRFPSVFCTVPYSGFQDWPPSLSRRRRSTSSPIKKFTPILRTRSQC